MGRTRESVLFPCLGRQCILSSPDLAVDYILFIKADVDVEPNLNEVRDTKYVTADGLKTMFNDPTLKFTPWFKLICHSLLFEWWEHLDEGLEKYMNEQQIRRM
jgi:isopentenyl-diphosphate Delta-isomerase